MQINYLEDSTDHSRCTLSYEENDGWLRATWRGFVDPAEAQRGAENFLAHAAHYPCARLLNDNTALRGPWFDAGAWLETIWLPHAQALGLRYVAHVVQADTHMDILTGLVLPPTLAGQFHLQVFQRVVEAEAWLRTCTAGAAPSALEPAFQQRTLPQTLPERLAARRS